MSFTDARTPFALRSDALPVPGEPEEEKFPVKGLLPNLVITDRTEPNVVKFYQNLAEALQFLANFEEPTDFRKIIDNGSLEEGSWIGVASQTPIQEEKKVTLTLRGFESNMVTFTPKSVTTITGLPDGVTLYYGKWREDHPFLALAQKNN